MGRHRAEDRLRPGLPAAGHLALSLHLDTAITLPVGVETYAAYALAARIELVAPGELPAE